MSYSLRTAANFAVDTAVQTVSVTAAALTDSIDWVQECAHRQAMLIDRIESWMTFVQGAFFAGVGAYLLIWAIGLTIKKKPSA